MKILLIQLSDLHCTVKDKDFTFKFEKITNVIKTLKNIDKVILIFSGDLVCSGEYKEFLVAKKFIGKFLKDVSDHFNCGLIPFKIVPGNHDMFLPENSRGASIIETWKLEDHLQEELDRMKCFFDYSKQKHCFIHNPFYDNEIIDFDGTKIQVCLLNSAPFSTRKPTDKEFHFLPKYVAEKIVRDASAKFKITVMHHSYEWCEWDTKEMLKKAMESDDITFFGHDHKAEAISSNYASGARHNIIMGGELNLDIEKDSSFNTVVLDSESKNIICSKFTWSINDKIFYPEYEQSIKISNEKLAPSENYLKNLLADDNGIGESLIDYYVVPKLSVEGSAFSINEPSEDVSVETIFEALRVDKAIRITGREGAGKTALLRYLYYKSTDYAFLPLLIENRDYRDSDINKMLKILFEEQYSPKSSHDYDFYKQLDNSSKIIFIDNIDLISNPRAKEKLVNSILDSGKLLIYTTKERDHDLEEIVKNKLQDKTIDTIEINPIYKQTRDNLVENIGNLNKKTPKEISLMKTTLDYLAQSQTGLFAFNPSGLIQYVKYLMRSDVNEKLGTKPISMIFESNIRNSIIEVCDKEYLANIYLNALEFVAKYMYFTMHTETIDIGDYRKIIDLYSKSKKTSLNEQFFLECCKKAKIIRQIEGSFTYRFFDKNTYAYFVAKAINRDFEKDRTKTDNLNYVMEHICFGINDTIILFLSFIRSNTKIITDLAAQALDIMDSCPEWNFIEKNLSFLHNTSKLSQKVPTKSDQREAKKQLEIIEKNKHDNISFKGIFDYNEEDVNNRHFQILRAFKFAQLVGRAIIDQYGALDGDEIDMILEALFIVPQKVVYAKLKYYQDQQDEIVKNILNFAKDNIQGTKISEEQVRELLGRAGTMYALNILNDIAFNCSNEGTLEIFEKAPYFSINHRIFKLMVSENSGNTSAFISEAISMRKEFEDNPYVSMIISQIARKHILYTSNIDHREIDKLISGNVLSPSSKPALLFSKETRNS